MPAGQARAVLARIGSTAAAASVPVLLAGVLSTLESFGLRVVLFGLFCLSLLLIWLIVTLARMLAGLLAKRHLQAALLFGVLMLTWPLIRLGLFAGPYVHLAIMLPSYQTTLRATPTLCAADIRFPWGDHALSGSDSLHIETLIYHCTAPPLEDHLPPPDSQDLLISRNQHLIGPWYIEHATMN